MSSAFGWGKIRIMKGKTKASLPAGFRDLEPEAAQAKRRLVGKIEAVFKRHSFLPIETPAIELISTLIGKGGTVDKQIFRVQHGEKNDWGLRFDLTVPLARYVGDKRPTFPFYRYQIAPVWRGEKPQKGRWREFWQADADIVGSESVLADAEIISLLVEVMAALKIPAVIRVNHRFILEALAQKLGLERQEAKALWGTIDKVGKITLDQATEEIEKLWGKEKAEIASTYLKAKTLAEVERILAGEKVKEGAERIREILAILGDLPEQGKVVFDACLARGLDYYTGVIFEASFKGLGVSVAGGGRYDHLIARLGGPDVPAVGVSFGIDRLLLALREIGLENKGNDRRVLVVNFSDFSPAKQLDLVRQLRKEGLETEWFLEKKSIGDQLRYANKKDFRWVIIWGSEEEKKGVVKLKDMEKKEEKEFSSVKELAAFLQENEG